MEFTGSNATNLMQKWIEEEFAYVSHKRDLGISDLREEQRIRVELQLPLFSHGNPVDWICQLEDSFHFFRLNGEERLKAAILSLEGDALRWFEWEHQQQPFLRWEELKEQMVRVFVTIPATSWSMQPDLVQRSYVVGKRSISLLSYEQIPAAIGSYYKANDLAGDYYGDGGHGSFTSSCRAPDEYSSDGYLSCDGGIGEDKESLQMKLLDVRDCERSWANSPEDITKGNMVNYLESDISIKGQIVSCDLTFLLESKESDNDPSEEEVSPKHGPYCTRPNFLSCFNLNASAPTPSPPNFTPELPHLGLTVVSVSRPTPLTNSPKPIFNSTPSRPIHQSNFLQPTRPSCHYPNLPTSINCQPNPIQPSKHNLPSLDSNLDTYNAILTGFKYPHPYSNITHPVMFLDPHLLTSQLSTPPNLKPNILTHSTPSSQTQILQQPFLLL